MTNGTVIYPALDTPSVLLDLDQFESNVEETTKLVVGAGIVLRPHVKVHENAILAKMQIEAGKCGIEVGNVYQAECMANEGIDDILIAHPFYGAHKMERLKKLINKPNLRISVVIDMLEQAEALSHVGQSIGSKIPVLIKIDTGIRRYGVLPGEPTLAIAKKLQQFQGVELVGIYAHEANAIPTDEGVAKMALEVGSIMAETARMLRRAGIKIEKAAVGGSPTFRATCQYIKEGNLSEITEIHPGACVVGDIMYLMSHGNTEDMFSLTVLTTVVSTSHTNYVVIDAGYKTFGNDSLIGRRDTPGFFWEGMPSFGKVKGRPDLWLGRLGAESGIIYYKDSSADRLQLGDRLEIIPNNATLTINLHDQLYGIREGVVETTIPVTGRGKGG